ncbi:MAG: YiiD C-terminal domain-containing protein [bacterium]
MDSTEKLKDFFESGIPFAARAGIEADRMEKDGITLKMPLDPNRNHIGTMYAGALFTLAEMMGGAVAVVYFMEHGFMPIVKGLNIKFVKPAETDITATWHMENDEVERVVSDSKEHGKAEYTINLELEDKDGVVTAVSEGFYQVRGSWKK